jgi:hypothetical protein
MQNIPLAPGEILFVNNHLAVHGRRRFQARFDGTDRWLRRLWLASDLRPSRHLRTSATARIIEDSPASVLDIIID